MLAAYFNAACPPNESGKRQVALVLVAWYIGMTTLAFVWLAVTRDTAVFGAFSGLWLTMSAPVFGFLGLAYGMDAWVKQVIPAQQARTT